MNDVLLTILQIVQLLLNVFWWIIIVQAILSILISFNVINTYNDFVSSLWRALNALTEPVYRPIRRVLPATGGLDFAPFVVLILMAILSNIIIPNIMGSLIRSSAGM